jgi:Domain of unknown function (DUF4055)
MAKTADVSTTSSAVNKMAIDWQLVCALLGGTRAMRAAGEAYLPKWPAEDDKAYECRLKSAVLFPAYSRTVETLTGKPFSKPVSIEDADAQFEEWLNNIDLQGRNLHSFAADQMELTIGYGLAGILVDVPTRDDSVRTVADERIAGIRPYLIQIKPDQILGWRSEMRDGKMQLVMLRLMECVTEEDGEFSEVEVKQVRVLEPFKWRVYRQNERKEWVIYNEGVTTIDFVPFVPTYGNRVGFMTAKPPLIEMAHMNVEHWQSASDQQNILHVARVPILTVTGVNDEDNFQLAVGASVAVKLPTDAKMEFVEHTGAAIEAGRNALDDLEERMRQAGAELLVIAPGKITATQVATEDAVSMCALQRITQDMQDALNEAMQMMADWMGQDIAPTCQIFNDFAAASLQEASADLLFKSASSGVISKETYFDEMKRRGIISSDRKWNDEQERIQMEGPALGDMTNDVPPKNNG